MADVAARIEGIGVTTYLACGIICTSRRPGGGTMSDASRKIQRTSPVTVTRSFMRAAIAARVTLARYEAALQRIRFLPMEKDLASDLAAAALDQQEDR